MIEIVDIKASINSKSLIQDKFFKNAEFLKDSRNRLITYTGGYTIVMPAIVKGEKWAFRCWHTPVNDAKERYSLIGKSIKKSKLPYFCSFDYIQNGLIVKGDLYPITKMKWVEGLNLKNYICMYYKDRNKIRKLATDFLNMVIELHSHHIAHGDLQHGNIIISDSGDIFLVDYDSMYVPEMKDEYPDIISGLVDYQHPARRSNRTSSDKLDFFSEVVIYTSILAITEKPDLVKEYNVQDSEALLFTSKDFESLHTSRIYNDLKKLNNNDINRCLEIVDEYLSINNLDMLNPIESYLLSIDVDFPKTVPIDTPFTINWRSNRAKILEIKGFGEIPLCGSRRMKLSDSKSITFILSSETGFRIEKSIQIKVAPQAVIKRFYADKEYSLKNIPVTISWEVSNAKTVKLSGFGEQASSGSIVVRPRKETTYTLEVEDEFGKHSQELEVKMLPLPVIETILVESPKIDTAIDIQAPNLAISNVPRIPDIQLDFINLKMIDIPDLKDSGIFIELPETVTPHKNLVDKVSSFIKSIFTKNN